MNTVPNPADAAAPTLEEMAGRLSHRLNWTTGASYRARDAVAYALTGIAMGGPERDAAVAATLARSPAVVLGVPAGVSEPDVCLWYRDGSGTLHDEDGREWVMTAAAYADATKNCDCRECSERRATLSPDAQAAAGQAPTPAVGVEPSSTGVAVPGACRPRETQAGLHERDNAAYRARFDVPGPVLNPAPDSSPSIAPTGLYGTFEISRLAAAGTGDAGRRSGTGYVVHKGPDGIRLMSNHGDDAPDWTFTLTDQIEDDADATVRIAEIRRDLAKGEVR